MGMVRWSTPAKLRGDLDVAVCAGPCGRRKGEPDISDEELLERLLELNLKYAAEEDRGIITPP